MGRVRCVFRELELVQGLGWPPIEPQTTRSCHMTKAPQKIFTFLVYTSTRIIHWEVSQNIGSFLWTWTCAGLGLLTTSWAPDSSKPQPSHQFTWRPRHIWALWEDNRRFQNFGIARGRWRGGGRWGVGGWKSDQCYDLLVDCPFKIHSVKMSYQNL